MICFPEIIKIRFKHVFIVALKYFEITNIAVGFF